MRDDERPVPSLPPAGGAEPAGQQSPAGPSRDAQLSAGPPPQEQGLAGHTLEELSAYLDAGRQPADPSIDGSPACRAALAEMERLGRLGREQLELEVRDASPPGGGWVARVLDAALGAGPAAARPGEPVSAAAEDEIRALVRAAEAEVDGVVVGRCRLRRDRATPASSTIAPGEPVAVTGEAVTVSVEASVSWGPNILELAEQLRAAIARRLSAVPGLVLAGVDVTILDVHRAPAPAPERG